MKKVLISLVLLIVAASVAACGGEDEGEPADGDGSTPTARVVEITFWHSEVASNLDAIQSLARRFNSEQDGVKVKTAFQGNDEEAMLKLTAFLGSGDVPALVYLAEVDTQRLVDSGVARPVQEFIDREDYDLSDFDEKAIQYYTVDGELYGMPFGVGVPLLYYNKLDFSEVGLDPEQPPKDLEVMRVFSQKLVKRDSLGNILRAGIALVLMPWFLEVILAEHGDFYVNNGNGREGRATEVVFDGSAGQAFFRSWHEMIEEGLAISVGRNPSYADALLAMGTGRATMSLSSSGALRSVVDVLERGEMDVEPGVGAVPGVPGGTGLPGMAGRSLWILTGRPEEEQEAAWKFIKWLLEPEQQAEWFAGSGYLPVRISAYDLPAAQSAIAEYPLFRLPIDLFLEAPSTPESLGPLLGPFRDVREVVATAMEETVVGSRDPTEALDDAAAEANEIIENYNRRLGE
ncbi:MAG: ABC transporter substrate-binding protein [Dehalococcoidia bacterium]|nr:MAG: ABC transporter substrate-binding protein [Dehalococcoidia bacterium]